MKYKEWLNEWILLYVKPTVKEKTYQNYLSNVRIHIAPVLGEYEIEELSVAVLQNFVMELHRKGNSRTGGELAASTVGLVISILQKSLRFAVAIGIVHIQHSDHIQRPKVDSKQVDCFSLAEQRIIEGDILERPRGRKIGVLLCLYTGLRIGELMALKWQDIDFQNSMISVNSTCRDGYVNGRLVKLIDTPKTRSSNRLIPLPVQLLPYLKILKEESVGIYVITGKRGEVSVRSYQKMFASMLNRLNIEHKGFHSLRHTFATRALECGMDIKTLSEILGHKNPNITLNRYAHSMMEHKIAMMNKVGSFLE